MPPVPMMSICFRSRTRAGLRLVVSIAAVVSGGLWAGCAETPATADPASAPSGEAAVTHAEAADLPSTFLLTGEVRARTAHPLNVPHTPGQRVQIRWMVEDGTEVRRGDKVFEFENSSFSANMEDMRLQAAEAVNALDRARAEARSAEADARFEVERKRVELEKARVEAEVPEEILSGREYQDRQLALRKALVELAKAEADLAATREAQAAEVAVQRVELERKRREVRDAEETRDSLAVAAPADGVLLVGNHPWEERRLQLGDTVWVGLEVAEIPDLSRLEVQARLSDVDEGRVQPGAAARVTPDAFPDMRLTGTIEEVSPVAREVEGGSLLRYFAVRVALDPVPAADRERLLPGMSVKVEVPGAPVPTPGEVAG